MINDFGGDTAFTSTGGGWEILMEANALSR